MEDIRHDCMCVYYVVFDFVQAEHQKVSMMVWECFNSGFFL